MRLRTPVTVWLLLVLPGSSFASPIIKKATNEGAAVDHTIDGGQLIERGISRSRLYGCTGMFSFISGILGAQVPLLQFFQLKTSKGYVNT